MRLLGPQAPGAAGPRAAAGVGGGGIHRRDGAWGDEAERRERGDLPLPKVWLEAKQLRQTMQALRRQRQKVKREHFHSQEPGAGGV